MLFICWLVLWIDFVSTKTASNKNSGLSTYLDRNRCNRTLTKNCHGFNFNAKHLYHYGDVFGKLLPEIDVYLECEGTDPFIQVYLNEDLVFSSKISFKDDKTIFTNVTKNYYNNLFDSLNMTQIISHYGWDSLLENMEMIIGSYSYLSNSVCENFNKTDDYFSKSPAKKYNSTTYNKEILYYVAFYGQKVAYRRDFRKVVLHCIYTSDHQNYLTTDKLYSGGNSDVYYEYVPVMVPHNIFLFEISPTIPKLCSPTSHYYRKLYRKTTSNIYYICVSTVLGLLAISAMVMLLANKYLRENKRQAKIATLSLKSYQKIVENEQSLMNL